MKRSNLDFGDGEEPLHKHRKISTNQTKTNNTIENINEMHKDCEKTHESDRDAVNDKQSESKVKLQSQANPEKQQEADDKLHGDEKSKNTQDPDNTIHDAYEIKRTNVAIEHKTKENESHEPLSDSTYSCDLKGQIILAKKSRFAGRFRVISSCGYGAFSRVFKVLDESDKTKKAVKCLGNTKLDQECAKNEISILSKIREHDKDDNHYCIHLLEHCEYKNHPLLVFPLLGESIFGFINWRYNYNQPFELKDVKEISRQILTAVSFVHSLDIVICDIKTENILFLDNELHLVSKGKLGPKNVKIKLIDFGISVHLSKGKKQKDEIQTQNYRAPEVLFDIAWDFSVDMWSVGCVLMELLNGKLLFGEMRYHLNDIIECVGSPPPSFLELMNKRFRRQCFDSKGQLRSKFHRPSANNSSSHGCRSLESYFDNSDKDSDTNERKQLLDLVKSMLCWMPNKRCTAASALKHAYFE